jgi:hypothetical protein
MIGQGGPSGMSDMGRMMRNMGQVVPRGEPPSATALERIDRYERMLNPRLGEVRTMKTAFDPLYAALGNEQKKTADQLFSGPMRLM